MHIHFPDRIAKDWREFLIHMGTITLGLLLALGFEHAGTSWSRHQELAHLRSDLRNEDQRNLQRGRELVRIETTLLKQQQLAQQAAIIGGTSPYRDLPQADADAQEVANPVWRAAVTDASVRLLTRDEVAIMGEIDHLVHADDVASDQIPQFELLLNQPQMKPQEQVLDFSGMNKDERMDWARAVHADIINRQRHLGNLQSLVAALQAVQSGATSLDQVVQAENSAS